jgi:serine/threonine-protein kinase
MYRFVSRLGEGGMGEVVQAEHRTLGHRVAVKLLRADHFFRFDLKDRMRIEAQACARIRHENLVMVTDYDETPAGRPFLVMELLQGRTLGEELERRGALPADEAIDVACQALAGLGAAHALGLVHRDIKPDNLFLCPAGHGRCVKLLDLGIAKIADAGRDPRTPLPLMLPTEAGSTVGTPRYASPEQSRGEPDIDARSDVYSMGWVLNAMLTGREPFPERRTQTELWQAHEQEMPALPSVVARQPIPADLDRIILRAIAKKREDRFASAEAFRAALVELASRSRRVNAPHTARKPQAPAFATGTEIIDPPGSTGSRKVPAATAPSGASSPSVATVQLHPAGAGAKTVELAGGWPTGDKLSAPVGGNLPVGTVDAVQDAAQRPVLPWTPGPRPPARSSAARLPRIVVVAVSLIMVACLGLVLFRLLKLW